MTHDSCYGSPVGQAELSVGGNESYLYPVKVDRR